MKKVKKNLKPQLMKDGQQRQISKCGKKWNHLIEGDENDDLIDSRNPIDDAEIEKQ
jgi:hypothetical protein